MHTKKNPKSMTNVMITGPRERVRNDNFRIHQLKILFKVIITFQPGKICLEPVPDHPRGE